MKPLLFFVLTAFIFQGCERASDKQAEELYQMSKKYANSRQFKQAIEVLQNLRINYEDSLYATMAEKEISEYQDLLGMVQSNQQQNTLALFKRIKTSLDSYKARFLAYPITPQDLEKMPLVNKLEWNDVWNRPILYSATYTSPETPRHTPDGYALACFGEDGLPGGEGPNRDYFFKNGEEVDQLVP